MHKQTLNFIKHYHDPHNITINTNELLQQQELLQTNTIKQIACGHYHTILLDTNNNIYTCGRNYCGELGLGHKDSVDNNNFKKVDGFSGNVKLISAGGFFTVIVTLQNEIYFAGKKSNEEFILNFIKLKSENNENIIKIKSGSNSSIIMNNKFELFAICLQQEQFYGNENFKSGAKFGFEDIDDINYFKKINLPTSLQQYNIKDFFCGMNYTIILSNEGTVYYCGQYLLNANIKLKKFTKFKLQFTNLCEQVVGSNTNIYFLTKNNEIYDLHNCKFNFYNKIKRIYSCLNEPLFIVSEENKIYKLQNNNEFKEIINEECNNLTFLTIYLSDQYLVVLNSNFNVEKEESKELKRMIALLFQQLFNSNSFNDVVFHFQ